MLSEKIRKLRKEKGLSQETLAEMLDISRQAISKWESGQSNPDIEYVIKMSDIFGVSTDYILKDTTNINSSEKNVTGTKTKKLSLISGIISSFSGFIGIFILKLLSSISPAKVEIVPVIGEDEIGIGTIINAKVYKGFWGYLEYHNLNWLFWLCIIFLFISVICFLVNFKRNKRTRQA